MRYCIRGRPVLRDPAQMSRRPDGTHRVGRLPAGTETFLPRAGQCFSPRRTRPKLHAERVRAAGACRPPCRVRRVSQPGGIGEQKGNPHRSADGRTPRWRVGPDGFYGSSDWGDEIDWDRLTGCAPRPLVRRKRRTDAPDCEVDPERVGAIRETEEDPPAAP